MEPTSSTAGSSGSCLARLLTAFVAATSACLAQVPAGWFVVSAFESTTGPGGVFLVSPTTSTVVPVGNLPPQLGTSLGVESVLVLDGGASLLCSTSTTTVGDTVSLIQLDLVGTTVAAAHVFPIGSRTGGGLVTRSGARQLQLLPDGRILFAMGDSTTPVAGLGGESIGILDRATGTLVPVPVTGVPHANASPAWTAFACSRDGTVGYAADWTGSPALTGRVWSFPLPSGGSATLLATVSGTVNGLDVGADGDLRFASGTLPLGLAGVGVIDPLGGGVTSWLATGEMHMGIQLEDATGNLLVSRFDANLLDELRLLSPAGAVLAAATPPPAGWGGLSSIDHNPAQVPFGAATPGANSYDWLLAPTLGGAPIAGNAGFSLSVASSPGTGVASVLALGFAAQQVPVLGVGLLVQPAVLVGMPSTPVATFVLPLPPALAGTTFFAQSIHLENGGGWAASRGLRISLIAP